MIHLTPHSLPQAEASAIGQWLRLPAARTYRKFLGLEAARLTAEAGNTLVQSDDPGDDVKAKELAEEAGALRQFIGLMDAHASVDQKFEVSDLSADHTNT